MKKILALVLALALVIVPMTFSASADAAITLTVGEDASVEAGDAIEIAVALDSADVCGAQFDIALGDLVYVDCDAASDSFTYDADANVIKYVDADLEGMNYTLFTIDATIPTDAENGDTFTPVLSNQKYSDYAEALLTVTEVVGTYTVGSAAPAAVLDTTLVCAGSSVDVADTLGIIFTLGKAVATKYDHCEVYVTMTKYDRTPGNMYNEYEAEPFAVPVIAQQITPKIVQYKASFYDIGLGELGLSFDYQIRAYDADDNFVAYSNVFTTTPEAQLKASKESTSLTALKTVITDLLNLSAAAQARFAEIYPDSDLADVDPSDYVNVGVDQTYATASLGDLNVVNETVKNGTSPAIKSITVGGDLAAAPTLSYAVIDLTNKYDVSKLRLELSYTSKNNEEITYTAEGSDWVVSSTTKTFTFNSIRLYDTNKVITAELYYDDVLCLTNRYTVETAVDKNLTNANVNLQNVFTQIGKFGASCRALFNYD